MNRVAIVTGASSGIGRWTALEYAASRYAVVLAARRAGLLEALADQCRSRGAPDAQANASALGMALSAIDDEARRTFKIKDSVKGVVVSAVEPNSAAAEKGLRAGDVIEEVNQQAVEKPADVSQSIDALKKAGKKSALLLVSNGAGDVRFVALALN